MTTGSDANGGWRSRAHWVYAALAYVALTVVVTWPLASQLGTAIPGPHASDTREFVWSQWWWGYALAHGQDPAQLTSIQYPSGMAFPLIYLMSQTFVIGIPIAAMFGPTLALNLLFLASFPTTALAVYALALELGADRGAAFLGGLIWAFFPNRMGHALAGHMFFLFTFSLPWMTLAWVRLLKAPGWRRAIGAGLLTTFASTLHPLNIAYFIAPVIIALLANRVLSAPVDAAASRRWAWIGPVALALATSAVTVLPLVAPSLFAQTEGQLGYLSQSGATAYSVDLTTLLAPAPDSPLPLPEAWRAALQRSTGSVFENIGTLGWVALGLSVVGARRWRRHSFVWAGLAFVGVVLALGPVLKVGGAVLTVAVEPNDPARLVLPYGWLAELPLFSWSRTPGRFLVLAALGLAVLAAQGLTVIHRAVRQKRSWLAGLVTMAACSGVMVEYLVVWPFTTEPVEDRPVFVGLNGPILAIPWGGNEGNLVTLYWQTQHEQPLVGGRMYRDLPGYRSLYDGLRNLLLEPLSETDIVPAADDAQRRAALAASGARTLTWDGALAGGPDRRDLLEQRLGAPRLDDGRIAVFDVPDAPIAPGELIWGLSTGWQPVEDWGGMPWRWIEDRASVIIATGEPMTGRLTFSAQPGLKARWLTVVVDGRAIARFGVADWAEYATPNIDLPAGLTQVDFIVDGELDRTSLDLRCWVQSPVFGPWPTAEDCNPNDERPRQFTLAFSDLHFAPPSEPTALSWDVGAGLTITDPGLPASARAGARVWIPITLVARQPQSDRLTVFVHVLDSTGGLVAQNDSEPVRGAFAATGWQAGDLIRYRIALDLPIDLPEGAYTLRLGVYPTGLPQRLPMIGPDVRDDTLLLGILNITP